VSLRGRAGGSSAPAADAHKLQLLDQPLVPERGPRIGVNARNFDPAQLGAVRIRWLDGAVTEKYLE
jgi:hypothetical protein